MNTTTSKVWRRRGGFFVRGIVDRVAPKGLVAGPLDRPWRGGGFLYWLVVLRIMDLLQILDEWFGYQIFAHLLFTVIGITGTCRGAIDDSREWLARAAHPGKLDKIRGRGYGRHLRRREDAVAGLPFLFGQHGCWGEIGGGPGVW